ncbi:polyphosphate kinase 1 [uncultured Kriegella sp.]|uniref:polyphosphate kinase 1 n=1 Tax=uncultured Kriegella sp. TaxID=1798910 RepID=UPI0030DB128E|tara:strand:+ start:37733 stop:39808 length:2076 start_codon:yes stop_codon:yes gene_type:complete
MEGYTKEENFTYRDREIDWLSFNERVLQEAADKRNPIIERLKFLAIFSSNLDEFFKVRISKLRLIKKVKKNIRKPLGLKPNKILKSLMVQIDQQQQRFGQIFRDEILFELNENNIFLPTLQEFSTKQKTDLNLLFEKQIATHLTILDSKKLTSDSFIEGALYIVAFDKTTDKMMFVHVPATEIGRFVEIPSEEGTHVFTYLEDVLKLNAQRIFPELEISSLFNIKISKDAELYLDDDYEGDWVELIHQSLSQRKIGQPTRLLYEQGMPKELRNRLRALLDLGKIDMFEGGDRHNFSDFFSLAGLIDDASLHFEPFPPLKHVEFEKTDSIFDLIAQKDQLLHFPYQSFRYIEDWLFEAARDVKVASIHISLYRIAKKSRLTSALLEALENGKKVTIFVEAKARFDEANNITWGRRFEDKGAQVFYSFPNVKVHSKILHIERLEGETPRGYAYIGTGNFNSKTAKIYCDHGLFTADKKITEDLAKVFRVLKREMLKPKLKRLLISPFNTRKSFEKLIQREIFNAQRNRPASIMAKMNSLEDKQMINWLYRASNAGVKIRLLVRGFCCLVPGVEGQSENIEVFSIVDRFLEHARVFLFHNSGEEEIFMGSADWMTRNLDKRIEVITPILDKDIFHELKELLTIQFEDNVKARIVGKEATNNYVLSNFEEKKMRSQYEIYDYLKRFSPSTENLRE